ncbi:MAG: helix-turn-helix transcriptional regulator [Oscillospiraceae bacterium]
MNVLYIKEYRKKAGISVPKMSELTGLSRRTIEDLEKRGDCLVSNALKIAEVLGVKLDDFLSPPNDE